MAEFKCPCCGSTNYIDLHAVSQSCDGTEDYIDNYGSIQNRPVTLKSRGLLDFGFCIWGDAHGEASLTANFTARTCVECGYVSLNAIDLVKSIQSDIAEIEKEENEILAEQAIIQKEINALQQELDAALQREREIQEKLGDENITIKQQRELQEELATVQIKTREVGIPKAIRLKQRELTKPSVTLSNLRRKKQLILGYRIIK